MLYPIIIQKKHPCPDSAIPIFRQQLLPGSFRLWISSLPPALSAPSPSSRKLRTWASTPPISFAVAECSSRSHSYIMQHRHSIFLCSGSSPERVPYSAMIKKNPENPKFHPLHPFKTTLILSAFQPFLSVYNTSYTSFQMFKIKINNMAVPTTFQPTYTPFPDSSKLGVIGSNPIRITSPKAAITMVSGFYTTAHEPQLNPYR